MEVDVDTSSNTVVAVRGDTNDPLFGAYTCIKGRHLGDQHHNPERLRTALKRRPDGGFDPIPTAQAFDEIAAKISTILAEQGPRAIASYKLSDNTRLNAQVSKGFRLGCDMASLQASPEGLPIYERMGFRHAGYYRSYIPQEA